MFAPSHTYLCTYGGAYGNNQHELEKAATVCPLPPCTLHCLLVVPESAVRLLISAACAQDIDPDPKKTSFFLAMQQCMGVVLVLDEVATATTRSWCCFEEVAIPAVSL